MSACHAFKIHTFYFLEIYNPDSTEMNENKAKKKNALKKKQTYIPTQLKETHNTI